MRPTGWTLFYSFVWLLICQLVPLYTCIFVKVFTCMVVNLYACKHVYFYTGTLHCTIYLTLHTFIVKLCSAPIDLKHSAYALVDLYNIQF